MTPTEKKLLRKLGQADKRFGLIEDGDRIMVAVSGGKDWGLSTASTLRNVRL